MRLLLVASVLALVSSQTATTPTFGPHCSCEYDKVWNDVVFVIDASAASSNSGLSQMWASTQDVLSKFNVQKLNYTASTSYMRVGIVTYGSNASVVADLGSVNNNDIKNLYPAYLGGNLTDLTSGLLAAMHQFDSAHHRINSKKVIVVVAETFNPNGVISPLKAAQTFKQNGGIIIVAQFLQSGAIISPTLLDVSTTGYYLNNLNNGESDMENALCDANCFCPVNTFPYTESHRFTPSAGCYSFSTVPSNFHLAGNKCKAHNNGFVASAENGLKTQFLSNSFFMNTGFYIGAQYDSLSGTWEWADGTPIANSSWPSGHPPTGNAAQSSCIYVNQNQWQLTDCRNAFEYACEMNPCDSTHYCP